VRSVSRRPVLIVVSVALAAVLLSGCATTKEKAARLQLKAARVTIGQGKTRVVRAGGTVTSVQLAVTSSGGRSAFVVKVRNAADSTVGDLPISVGYTLGSRRVYVNDAAGVGYFGAHLPPIKARQELTWVYRARHAVPAGARPFALVGAEPAPRARYTADASVRVVGSKLQKSRLRVKVTNLSDIPQYQLQVYAYSHGRHGYIAAGSSTVGELDSGQTRNLEVPLVGRYSSSQITVEAVPTILQ
jgi:hypothetical protein